ncbi:MAG: glucose-6-phosphate isomerase [Nitrospiraceae bacterium]|nr:glucose-6-phosphate isomerase [Nitrospiraceae bacterium]
MAKPFSHTLAPPFDTGIAATLRALTQQQVVERLWAKDHRLWNPEPREIADRLGWLDLHGTMHDQLANLARCTTAAKAMRVKDVVLLGMGGSSLGPEVLAKSFGSQPNAPRLWVLDSTVPEWVRQVTARVLPSRTLFLVASKSGGTIEVLSLFAHFWKFVAKGKGNQGGKQFVAITDPGTSLEKLARDYGFGQIFLNPSDIGGRYSVLSLFGLVPAALLGLHIPRLLERAGRMAEECRTQRLIESNPGAYLGAAMGSLASAGRDKVTVITSPSLSAFGLWVEQLLAESTGKEGRGLIPVAQEPLLAPAAYGQDRFFVYLRLRGEQSHLLDRQVRALGRAGHPLLQLNLQDRYDLGAEFFRWEFATAVAGHVLGIHPFDQPNVQESKDNTARVLETFQSTGRIPTQPDTAPEETAEELSRHVEPGTYVAILAYTATSRALEAAIRRLRRRLLATYRIATTFGYGPRYLHSTGQLHKGGPQTGRFLELVDRMKPDLPIPGKPFTFGTLAVAQAAGDLASLRSHGRLALRIRLGKDPAATVDALTAGVHAPSGDRTASKPVRRKTSR